MDDESVFTFNASIEVPEEHGRYRSRLLRDFGLMVRAILLTKEGCDFQEATPPNRLKIDVDAQGMALMLNSTFDWLQSLGLLINLRNQSIERSFNDSTG